MEKKRLWIKILAFVLVGLMALGSVYATVALLINMW